MSKKVVYGVDWGDQNGRESHEPANGLAPGGILVRHVRQRLVTNDVEEEHSLRKQNIWGIYQTFI